MDIVQIYDFENKLCVFNASFPQVFQVEVENEERKSKCLPTDSVLRARSIYMHVHEKNGALAVL